MDFISPCYELLEFIAIFKLSCIDVKITELSIYVDASNPDPNVGRVYDDHCEIFDVRLLVLQEEVVAIT